MPAHQTTLVSNIEGRLDDLHSVLDPIQGSESMEDSDSLTVCMDVEGCTKVTDSVQTIESHSLR